MQDLSNKNVIQVNKNGIKYLQFRKLLQYEDKISHCFTLKNLTFGDNENFYDIQDEALLNYDKIAKAIGTNSKNVVRPFQTHTNCVKSVTNEKGIFIEKLKDVDRIINKRKKRTFIFNFC